MFHKAAKIRIFLQKKEGTSFEIPSTVMKKIVLD